MTYKELEQQVLALSIDEAVQLLEALNLKLARVGVGDRQAFHEMSGGGSTAMEATVQRLLERLAKLPPERQAEVGDFIEFLHKKERAQVTSRDAAQASEASFARIWDNDDDALYDKL
ncbi:MAG: DUF2281 domain-containing protein [Gammaproteobacteria bacterium]